MANRQAFGRRITPQVQAAPVRVEPVAVSVVAPDIPPVEEPLPPVPQEAQPSIEDELREWKLSRRKSFEVPWSQLSLVASLCFGVASLILPDSVNDNVQWLLYALMAASAWVAYSKRKRKPAT